MQFFDDRGDVIVGNVFKAVKYALGVVLALVLLFGSFYSVDQGEMAVVTRFGAVPWVCPGCGRKYRYRYDSCIDCKCPHPDTFKETKHS